MKEDSGLSSCLGMGFAIVVAMVIGSILNGYTLTVLWRWFAVPVFGLPELSIPYAIGLAMIVGFLTYQTDASRESKQRDTGEFIAVMFGSVILRPALTLVTGWIVLQFV